VLFGIARLALLGWFIARVFQGTPLNQLILPAVGIAVVMILRGCLEYFRTMVAHNTAAKVQVRLRTVIFDKVVELGPSHFGLERTGNAILAMIDGVEQLEVYFGQYLPQLIISAVTPLLIFGVVAFLDLPVALVMLAAALVTLIAPQIFHGWDEKNSLWRSRAYKAFAAEFLDSVQGLTTLKSFGQSGARGETLKQKSEELFNSTMWVLATNSLARGITDTGIAVGAAATLALGAFRVVEGSMDLAALTIILMLGVEVFRPLRDMRSLMHNGMVAQASAKTIFDLVDSKPIVTGGGGVIPAGELVPTVTFKNVSFAYPGGRRTTHKGLDFEVKAGERVSFVGTSGVGKSSIVRLLLRFYDPDRGVVKIGERDLRDLTFDDIRRQIAVVNQDTYLFHGSVEDNLRLGKPEASQGEIQAACRAANAQEFVEKLPNGYATVIGERGIRLSGGQRQRIAIARAILRDAPILVLDEALSAVDAENESVIQDALDRLMEGRTTLIFAHRLSSVIGSDRILVLDKGKIEETGSHEELMLQHGVYYGLMAAQAEEGAQGKVKISASAARPIRHAAPAYKEDAQFAPTDAIVKAEGLGWVGAVRELMKYILPYKGKCALTFGFGVTRVVAFIGIGAVSALAVRAVKTGEPFTDLLLVLAVLAPVAGVFHWFESWVAHDMAFRLLAKMRIALFEKLDRLAPAYMVRRRTGDMVAMATHDVETVEYFFAHTVAPAFVAILVPSVVLGVLVHFGWELAAALAPFLGLVALSPFMMRKRVDELGSRAREALGELNAHAVDTIQGLAEIAAYQRMPERRAELIERTKNHHAVRLPFFRDLTIQSTLLEVVTGLGALTVVAVGASLVDDGRLESGILPLLTLLSMAAFLPISEISNIGRQLADTLGSTRRLCAVGNEPVPVSDGKGVAIPKSTAGGLSVVLDEVNFQYETANRRALCDVSLVVPAGKTMALVGSSGAGKTTIAHLLMRFWDPQSGVICLGNHNLRDYALDDLRRKLALVAQDTYLFNDTLRANILIANPDADEVDLKQALQQASLGEFVEGLPDGLNTQVGERGMSLSGGQRQRLAIARAFLKDAPVLILDEATSHLDAVNEQSVRNALEGLMADRTTIIIAHRLSTVRNADMIVAIDEGRVMESGTHDELLAKGGLYKQLVVHQLARSGT